MMFFRNKSSEYLVVFLGNPGRKFENSRHNAGFMTADLLSKRRGFKIDKLKFRSLCCRAKLGGKSVVLMKPQTYMNLSGQAVGEAARYYRIPPERVIVVFDDMTLLPGRLRIRRDGSAGGHNGIKSIIEALGTDGFPRIKIGVGGPPHPDFDAADWVLGDFNSTEREIMENAFLRAGEALECILEYGIERAMNEYN
ncbi:MAG: aminoacyl-tRNA hydrolase [Oscillospiraceae bacterium]|jgi:PTH1 family peptidyl-tRNA hydrolase